MKQKPDGAIRDARGHNVKAIRSLPDPDTPKASKKQDADIGAAIETCRQENARAFGAADAAGAADSGMWVSTGGEHGTGGSAHEEDGVIALFPALNVITKRKL